jgi:hypothetical protein
VRDQITATHEGGKLFASILLLLLLLLVVVVAVVVVVVVVAVVVVVFNWRHAVAWLVEALCYKLEGSGLDSRRGHWIFQFT